MPDCCGPGPFGHWQPKLFSAMIRFWPDATGRFLVGRN